MQYKKYSIVQHRTVRYRVVSNAVAWTRYLRVCPVKVAIFCMVGYFHTITWLREYPCVDTISFTFFDHIKLHTYMHWKREEQRGEESEEEWRRIG